MAFNPKDLTVDFRKLMRLSVSDRVNMAKSEEGLSYLASLTPTQLAQLFPDYYKKANPDIGIIANFEQSRINSRAMSGYVPAELPPQRTWSPVNPGNARITHTDRPAAKPSELKPSWAPRLQSAQPQTTAPQTTIAQPPQAPAAPAQQGAAPAAPQAVPQAPAQPGAPPAPTATATPKTAIQLGLIDSRTKLFGKEIADDGVMRQLAALEKKEVGGMSEKSKLDWIETLVNRAAVMNASLMSRLQGRNEEYWGGGVGDPRKVSDKDLAAFKQRMAEVVNNGRDNTKGFTDNASNAPGNRLADKRIAKLAKEGRSNQGFWTGGEYGKGEFVYVDTPYAKRVPKYREQITKAGQELANRQQSMDAATAVPIQNENKTGSVSDANTRAEKIARQEGPSATPVQDFKYEVVDRTGEFKGYGAREKPQPYQYVGVHYTGGESLAGALSVARNRNIGYQYLIDKDGKIHMVQDPDKGRSNHWGGEANVHPKARNSNAVGISYVASGNKTITEAQRKAGLKLIEDVRKKYSIPVERVLGHGEVTEANHRAGSEGYGLLEPFRQKHGLVPGGTLVPDIGSKSGLDAWKRGQYNYDLKKYEDDKPLEAPVAQPVQTPTVEAAPPVQQRGFMANHPDAPAQAAPAQVEAPKAEPVKQDVPEFQYGGEAQAEGDNATVIGEQGTPLFTMNTQKERMSYDPASNNLKVEPTRRTNTDALAERQQERQQAMDDRADARQQQLNQAPVTAMAAQPAQQSSQSYWDNMMNKMKESSGNIYETASFHRAVAKSRFIEVGDTVKGGHHSYGASNLKLT